MDVKETCKVTAVKNQTTPRTGEKLQMLNSYRRKSLFPFAKDHKMYEVSVQIHPGNNLHVMYQTVTSSNLNCPKAVTRGTEFTTDYSKF